MSTVRERAVENATEITSMLVIGLGLLALFTGFSPIPFWVIFAVGFAVVVPIVAILFEDESEDEPESVWDTLESSFEEMETALDRVFGEGGREKDVKDGRNESTTDALSTLRGRYARGELTDDQFERKLDALLETESPENAAEWRTRDRQRERERIEERS